MRDTLGNKMKRRFQRLQSDRTAVSSLYGYPSKHLGFLPCHLSRRTDVSTALTGEKPIHRDNDGETELFVPHVGRRDALLSHHVSLQFVKSYCIIGRMYDGSNYAVGFSQLILIIRRRLEPSFIGTLMLIIFNPNCLIFYNIKKPFPGNLKLIN